MPNFIVDDHGIKRFLVTININGDDYTRLVKGNTLLINFIRDEVGLTGTKRGCEMGDCGSCTILMGDTPVNSCLILAVEADGKSYTTIEGVAATAELDPLQENFINYGASQCGYCTPGMIISSKALLDKNPKPSEKEIREGISGNLCRCTGYVNIIKAVMATSGQEPEEEFIKD